MFVLLALLLSTPWQAPGAGPDVTRLAMAAPTTLLEIDTGKLKGQLAVLAWSPDGSQVCLKTVERDRYLNEKATSYLVTLGQAAKGLVKIDGEPPWMAGYWAWKSGPFAPRNPSFKIEVETRRESVRATNTPTGGDIAGMGPPSTGSAGQGVPQDVVAGAALQTQQATTVTLRLKGQILGEWVNQAVQPGLTFGWAPASIGMIAFVERTNGRVTLMDPEGHRREIAGSKDCLLPAWSEDGTRLVYLQKKDRKKYTLTLIEVQVPPATR